MRRKRKTRGKCEIAKPVIVNFLKPSLVNLDLGIGVNLQNALFDALYLRPADIVQKHLLGCDVLLFHNIVVNQPELADTAAGRVLKKRTAAPAAGTVNAGSL